MIGTGQPKQTSHQLAAREHRAAERLPSRPATRFPRPATPRMRPTRCVFTRIPLRWEELGTAGPQDRHRPADLNLTPASRPANTAQQRITDPSRLLSSPDQPYSAPQGPGANLDAVTANSLADPTGKPPWTSCCCYSDGSREEQILHGETHLPVAGPQWRGPNTTASTRAGLGRSPRV